MYTYLRVFVQVYGEIWKDENDTLQNNKEAAYG